MADEMQDSQKEAQKKNELPEGVSPEAIPVDQYTKENEQVKDKLKEFGVTDLEQFIAKVTSNAVFGRQAIRKLLGLDTDSKFFNPEHKTSPQENNVTGQLDHATYPPKVKGTEDGTLSKDTDAITA